MGTRKLRKVNTNKRKHERKKAQRALQENASLMLDMPEECAVCHTSFDKRSKEMAQTWNVTVYKTEGKVFLTCPPCWATVKRIAEEGETND